MAYNTSLTTTNVQHINKNINYSSNLMLHTLKKQLVGLKKEIKALRAATKNIGIIDHAGGGMPIARALASQNLGVHIHSIPQAEALQEALDAEAKKFTIDKGDDFTDKEWFPQAEEKFGDTNSKASKKKQTKSRAKAKSARKARKRNKNK